MTYTLVFRITREVWDALERGEKTVEYRDNTPFWARRMNNAIMSGGTVIAKFLCGSRTRSYYVTFIDGGPVEKVPERWRGYLTTPEVWAVELGRRVE